MVLFRHGKERIPGHSHLGKRRSAQTLSRPLQRRCPCWWPCQSICELSQIVLCRGSSSQPQTRIPLCQGIPPPICDQTYTTQKHWLRVWSLDEAVSSSKGSLVMTCTSHIINGLNSSWRRQIKSDKKYCIGYLVQDYWVLWWWRVWIMPQSSCLCETCAATCEHAGRAHSSSAAPQQQWSAMAWPPKHTHPSQWQRWSAESTPACHSRSWA